MLYRRGKIWHYDFTVAGRRHRGTTQQTVLARARMVEADLVIKARNRQLPPGTRKPPMFRAFAQEFTEYLEQGRLMPGSRRYYRSGLRTLKTKALAHMRIDQISDRVVETTQFDRSGAHANCALRTLRRMLRLAREWNLLDRVPRIKLVRESRRTATLDAGAEKLALEALPQPWRDVFLMMCDSGMRNEEAVACRWEHIDFDRGLIFNPRVKAPDTDGWVPLSERLKAALQARHKGQTEGWVFPSRQSKTGHLWPNLSRPFAKVREACGLSRRLVPYSARHTFGTAMLEMTGDVVFVGKLMGHRNPLTTQRYLHPSLHRAKELIDRRNRQAAEALAQRHSLRHNEGSSVLSEGGATD